jgi:hypothetical protein
MVYPGKSVQSHTPIQLSNNNYLKEAFYKIVNQTLLLIYFVMKNLLVSILLFYSLMAPGQYYECQKKYSSPGALKNSIEFELFGHGLFYSLNYERLFLNYKRFKTLGQIGIAYYPEITGVIPLWIPVSVNQLISFDSHHMELGIGQVIHNEGDRSNYEAFGSFKVGYRYQKTGSRLLFKIAFTPFIEYWSTLSCYKHSHDLLLEFHPSGGIALGYNF